MSRSSYSIVDRSHIITVDEDEEGTHVSCECGHFNVSGLASDEDAEQAGLEHLDDMGVGGFDNSDEPDRDGSWYL